MQKTILAGESIDLASATLSCIGDGIISTDASGSILYMNHIAEEIAGWTIAEVAGKAFDALFTFFNAETKIPVRSPVVRVLEDGITVGLENNSALLAKSSVQKYISATCSPVRSSNGCIAGVVIVFRDITRIKTLENAHINEEKNLNNILDQIPSLVWKTDTNLNCNYVNKSWTAFTGIGMDVSSEFNWKNVIHPDDLDRYYQERNASSKAERSFETEVRFRRYDGKYRWCLLTGRPYYDLDGQYSGYIGLIHDITERKEAEEGLKRYRILSRNAREIMLFLDMEGNIIEANKAAVDAYGYTYEELCSLNIRQIRDDWGYTRQQMMQADQMGITFEAVHRRKDGSTFQVEVSSQGTDMDGNRVLLSLVRDITERKKAEKKIFESQVKYRSLFMNMHSGYAYYKVIYDAEKKPVDLKFIEVNEAFEKFFNIKKKQIISRTHAELFPDMNIIMQRVSKYENRLINGESVHIDELFSSKYNKWFSIAIYSPKEKSIVTIVTDITHLKQSELKLIAAKDAAEAANKAKSEFLANMSHEIRTPINGMVGMLDLTLMTNLNNEQKDNLITAKNCSAALLKIINDVLDFSKMEAGKLAIESINFNIRELIEEIVKTHANRIEKKGLELTYTLSSNIPAYLVGDPYRIRQVLNNLLSNAMKFTERGEIALSVKSISKIGKEVELKFTVSDTGIGIARENMGCLFQSFNQIDSSFTKKYGGTGLGLAISKQLVEMMEGKIGVVSDAGKGSEFFFILKLKQGHSVKVSADIMTGSIKPLRQRYILLAEDDSINRSVMMKMLNKLGHRVDVACNGKEVLHLFKQGKYDAVLMDIQMPEMDGIEASKRMKEMESSGSKHTPVIAMTAYALHGDKERFLSLGMDEYLPKPIQMNELCHTLESVASSMGGFDPLSYDRLMISENGEIVIDGKNPPSNDINNAAIIHEIEKAIEMIITALENDDLLVIENIAHEIKTLSAKINADGIKNTAFKIELAARRSNLEAVHENLGQIGHDLKIYTPSFLQSEEADI